MRELFVFVAQNYAYLLGVAVSVFAMRVAWDAYRSGATPFSSISRGIGMCVTFFVVITVAPGLFEWGVNSSAQKFQNGTVGRNLLAITQQGVNLAISATNPTSGTIIIPTPIPVTEFVSNMVNEVAGSAPAAQPAAAPKPPAAAPANQNLWTAPAQPTPEGRGFGAEYLQRQQSATSAPTPHAIYTPQSEEYNMWTPPAQPTPEGRGFGADYLQRNGGGGPQTYTVVSGDSLGKIANRLGVDAGDLCRANLTVVRNNCNLLRSGMVLAIP